MKKLDLYITKKYLVSFFFFSLIFLFIAVVIDITEKLENFIGKGVPMGEIVVYYLTYIPHMFAILAPLFVFISVIWFTSKMASTSEIIAVLGNGISYYRFLRPYLMAGAAIALLLVVLNNWAVPEMNKYRVDFLNRYVHYLASNQSHINLNISRTPGEEAVASLQNYNFNTNEGYQFSLEHYSNNELVYQLRSPRIRWHSEVQQWEVTNYEVWRPGETGVDIETGQKLDTVLGFSPEEFVRRLELKEMMTFWELKNFIDREKLRGGTKTAFFEVELYNRTSNAVAIIILTFIGVAFSTRKKRGGTGLNLAIGLALSAFFILTLRFSTTFATNAALPPALAVWIPNILFGALAVVLVRMAPK